ncbi:NYN domain-containing protein [Okeanomitos corallinicola TIOX110]|uniref:NYN domain-containing protein n=1 Tax=Okeanomitos corallinicola TIOX110 TaxID=3133117 RepID=A0ABZ2UN52_9CYAN
MQVASIKTPVKAEQETFKISIYCDFQNVPFNAETAINLLEFAKSKGRLITKKIYYNSLVGNFSTTTSSLEKIGYQIMDVTCSLKNSVDNQIFKDSIDDMWSNNAPDVFILVSGDGDFVNLLKDVKAKGKSIIIFAKKGNLKKSLKDVANEFHFIDDLPQLVEKKNQPQTNVIHPQISYNDAVECLMKAVNKALSQNKPTNYSYVNQLMGQISANYQGICSISIPNGTKFKKFGQFVDMVVKEGKVKRQNQELFLIELNQIAA